MGSNESYLCIFLCVEEFLPINSMHPSRNVDSIHSCSIQSYSQCHLEIPAHGSSAVCDKCLHCAMGLLIIFVSSLCLGNWCFLLYSSGKCVCKCCRSTPTRGWRRQMRCFGASSSLNSTLGSTYFTAVWRKPDKKKWLASSLLPFTPPYPVSLFLHRNPLLS